MSINLEVQIGNIVQLPGVMIETVAVAATECWQTECGNVTVFEKVARKFENLIRLLSSLNSGISYSSARCPHSACVSTLSTIVTQLYIITSAVAPPKSLFEQLLPNCIQQNHNYCIELNLMQSAITRT